MLRLTPGSGLFLTLTFKNRTSIQCNSQFKSEDMLSIP
jgi:hypothetical protein